MRCRVEIAAGRRVCLRGDRRTTPRSRDSLRSTRCRGTFLRSMTLLANESAPPLDHFRNGVVANVCSPERKDTAGAVITPGAFAVLSALFLRALQGALSIRIDHCHASRQAAFREIAGYIIAQMMGAMSAHAGIPFLPRSFSSRTGREAAFFSPRQISDLCQRFLRVIGRPQILPIF